MNELMEKKEKWEILYNYIVKLNYGDTILHNEIENTIEEKYDSNRYRSIIAKTKKMLLESSKCIRSLVGQGYMIVDPDDYTDMSLKHIKSGFKKIDNGYKVLQYAPVNDMSEEGLKRHRHVSDKAMTFHAMIAGGCTELKLLNKKSKLMITGGE